MSVKSQILKLASEDPHFRKALLSELLSKMSGSRGMARPGSLEYVVLGHVVRVILFNPRNRDVIDSGDLGEMSRLIREMGDSVARSVLEIVRDNKDALLIDLAEKSKNNLTILGVPLMTKQEFLKKAKEDSAFRKRVISSLQKSGAASWIEGSVSPLEAGFLDKVRSNLLSEKKNRPALRTGDSRELTRAFERSIEEVVEMLKDSAWHHQLDIVDSAVVDAQKEWGYIEPFSAVFPRR